MCWLEWWLVIVVALALTFKIDRWEVTLMANLKIFVHHLLSSIHLRSTLEIVFDLMRADRFNILFCFCENLHWPVWSKPFSWIANMAFPMYSKRAWLHWNSPFNCLMPDSWSLVSTLACYSHWSLSGKVRCIAPLAMCASVFGAVFCLHDDFDLITSSILW